MVEEITFYHVLTGEYHPLRDCTTCKYYEEFLNEGHCVYAGVAPLPPRGCRRYKEKPQNNENTLILNKK